MEPVIYDLESFSTTVYKENVFKCWMFGCVNELQFLKEFIEYGEFHDQIVDHIVSKSAKYSYYYSWLILKGPFPKGEPVIMTSARYSYWYAYHMMGHNRWPEAESIIASDGLHACWYAFNILNAPWPEAEAAIAKNAQASCLYAIRVLNAPFPLGEPTIKNDVNGWRSEYERFFKVTL